jgi:NitT/TauT family transport system substrate-binding protein
MASPARRTFLMTLSLAVAPAALRAQAAATIRVNTNLLTSVQPSIALELGLFEKAGLDVKIGLQPSAAAIITGVVTGAIDAGTSTVVLLSSALLHGVPLKYFAPNILWNSATPYSGLVVAKDGPIQAARDFEGKTMGIVSLRDATHLVALAYLVKNGVDTTKVSFIETPFSAMLQAVSSGRVAGAIAAEPFMPQPTDNLRVFAYPGDTLGKRYMSSGFFSTAAWLNANTAIARKFAAAMRDAAHWANDPANRQRTVEIFEKYTKLERPAAERVAATTSFADQLRPEMIDPWLDWAYRLKFTERRVRAQEMIA